MSDIAIKVNNLGKAYTIGLEEKKSDTLFGSVVKSLVTPFRNFRNLKNLSSFSNSNRKDIIYALKGISFDVKHGEAVAIIGHNGAGKSTLLKIISRITDPSEGRIDIYGRVSSLLEVGTGFHPELTGRENVYLNGTILGMRKAEIDKKFDEIVEFAGIAKFIDTPVKRYSSGMRVRLAFSVAAHLEAEILLIDEVLAVGDVAFQKKCLGKMNEVAKEGRTVLFVSHNMGAVKELCTRGIVLNKGEVTFDGNIKDCIIHYLNAIKEKGDFFKNEETDSREISIGDVYFNGGIDTVISPGDSLKVSLPIRTKLAENPLIKFFMEDFMGQDVINLSIHSSQFGVDFLEGSQIIEITFPPLWLAPGVYSGYFRILNVTKKKVISNKSFFEVNGTKEIEDSGFHSSEKHTVLAPVVKWSINHKVLS